ncbi:MAG: hypothetical protein H7A45_09595 [Verrucomicrobiales bacterium]|nr:hypothetical protein [Verrucomicrobiales bacterium]MCP5526262.1 hypothetical protein [Verrucomicrobiales bacterium]
MNIRTLIALPAVLILAGLPDAEAATIVAGDDLLYSTTGKVTITINNAFIPGGLYEVIDLVQINPPAIVHRDAQVGTTIDTEIVSLELAGTSSTLGPLTVRVGAGLGVVEGPTLGQVTDVVQNPADPGFPTGDPSSFQSGKSYFNALFEIDTSLGVAYNKIPHQLGPVPISSLPPDPIYYPSPASLPLWLDIGTIGDHSDDVQIGMIGPIFHTPEPDSYALIAVAGLLGFGVYRRRVRG